MSHKITEEIISANTERMALEQAEEDFEQYWVEEFAPLLNAIIEEIGVEQFVLTLIEIGDELAAAGQPAVDE